MGKIVKIFLLLLVVKNVRSQSNQEITSLIYDRVYKNILAYNLINNRYSINGYDKEGYLTSVYPFFEVFLPNKGFKFDMSINKASLIYPNKKFILYSIYVEKLSYSNEKGDTTISFGGARSALGESRYLVAIDSSLRSVKFISGDFFLNKISEDFSFSENDTEAFINYINIKCFNFQLEEINFKGKKGSLNYFTAYSKTLQKRIEIKISNKNLEQVRISRVFN